MLISPNSVYKKIPSYSKYDYYDVHFADDVQGADTDLVEDIPANWIVPLPYEIDPDEAIVLKSMLQYVSSKGLNALASEGAEATLDILRTMLFYFKGDEIDESTPDYEDETKEALGFIDQICALATVDVANGIQQTEALLEFESPVTFPLNVALKTFYTFGGVVTSAVLDQPQHLFQKYFYRVGRNQLDVLERVILLLRQEL